MFNKEYDLALALTNPDLTGYQVEDMCRNLPKNTGWNAIRHPTLKRLMIKKFEQNPTGLHQHSPTQACRSELGYAVGRRTALRIKGI